eukprot:1787263-Rhodomonas_salina.1
MAILGTLLFPSREAGPSSASNFSPPALRWPWQEKGLAPFRTTTLTERLSAWRSLLGPYMGNAALTVLREGFVIPHTNQHLIPCYERNHPTVEEDPELIHLIIAKYVLTGTVETVPRFFPAQSIIHP